MEALLNTCPVVPPFRSRNEVFIQIDGYPNYSVSNLGNIKNNKTNKIIKKHLNNYGYHMVTLCGRYTKSVHRLVAIHFIPNPANKETVNHKNGIKTDNCLSNLEWATRSENMQHCFDTGLQVSNLIQYRENRKSKVYGGL